MRSDFCSFDITLNTLGMADVLYPIIESCENLFVSLGTLEEKDKKEDIILDHIKSCTEKRIQIGDFKNS